MPGSKIVSGFLAFVAFCVFPLCFTSCQRSTTHNDSGSPPEDRPDIINVQQDDKLMNAATLKARATIEQFFKKRDTAGERFDGMLKVGFADPGDDFTEHMWVEVTGRKGNTVTGMLLSEPGSLTSVKYGDEVKFPISQVSDWLFSENGKAIGAFTVRVMRDQMDKATRQMHDDSYPFTFD